MLSSPASMLSFTGTAAHKDRALCSKSPAYTVLTAKCDGYTKKFKIYVLNHRQMKSMRKAVKTYHDMENGKIHYSQSLRMKKGYADCSSLAWRIMKAGGCTFGSPNWAPDGGVEYRWYKKKGKMLPKKHSVNDIMPGDVVFWMQKQKGKTKVFHVEVALGYGISTGIGAGPWNGIGTGYPIGTPLR